MFSKLVFAQLVLAQTCLAKVAQNCIWADGSTATGFSPCTTNSSATTGTCCLSGEACLSSGLCYGSIGLVYRGACLNTWGGGDCPTYCDDIANNWANFYACPFANTGSADGPQGWYCGAQKNTVCAASNESHIFTTIVPGVATRLLISSSSSSFTSTSVSSGPATAIATSTNSAASSSTTASGASTPSVACPSSSNGVAIGLGVALGVMVLALCGISFWAFRSHQKQRAQLHKMQTYSPTTQQDFEQKETYDQPRTYQYPNIMEADSGSRRINELPAHVAEMGNGK